MKSDRMNTKTPFQAAICFAVFSLIFSPGLIFSQITTPAASTATTSASSTDSESKTDRLVSENAQLAMSFPDYRVTAGDIYTLAYMAGTQAVTYTIVVDSTYRIRVANLGIVDAAGRTYTQLKTQVEAIVSNNYPMSGVQFVLSGPATFVVYVQGEVTQTAESRAWALSRLSSLIDDNLTSQASLRDVRIRSTNGQTRTFDLFKARRQGDLSQDPYLRPGDVVTFNRAVRTVYLTGAVERPGTYQLLPGENLKELIELYGSGFTPMADKTRMELLRRVNSQSVSGDKIFIKEEDLTGNYVLENYDSITVSEITVLQPVIFVEGAVAAAETSAAQVSTRLTVTFNRGENYAPLIRRNKAWFSAVSDTQNAYIIRGDAHIPLNLNPMLYDAGFRSDITVEENDTLLIPFRQYFVTVAGAVRSPGRFPYIPDRDWEYYVALAGGFVPERNVREVIDITDLQGNRLSKTDVIPPETIINAKTNAFLYYFNQYAPVITTTLSIIMTFLSLQATLAARQ